VAVRQVVELRELAGPVRPMVAVALLRSVTPAVAVVVVRVRSPRDRTAQARSVAPEGPAKAERAATQVWVPRRARRAGHSAVVVAALVVAATRAETVGLGVRSSHSDRAPFGCITSGVRKIRSINRPLVVRIVVATAVLAGLFFFGPMPAQAYPPAFPDVTVRPSTPTPVAGSQLSLSLAGFCAGSPVRISLRSADGATELTTVTADAQGSATVTITAPSTPGPYWVLAEDTVCIDRTASGFLDVQPAPPTPPPPTTDPMPKTGVNVDVILRIAAILFTVGVLLVVPVYRRREDRVGV
jgi:hypothetical protein